MKQATEQELRELLTKAFNAGWGAFYEMAKNSGHRGYAETKRLRDQMLENLLNETINSL